MGDFNIRSIKSLKNIALSEVNQYFTNVQIIEGYDSGVYYAAFRNADARTFSIPEILIRTRPVLKRGWYSNEYADYAEMWDSITEEATEIRNREDIVQCVKAYFTRLRISRKQSSSSPVEVLSTVGNMDFTDIESLKNIALSEVQKYLRNVRTREGFFRGVYYAAFTDADAFTFSVPEILIRTAPVKTRGWLFNEYQDYAEMYDSVSKKKTQIKTKQDIVDCVGAFFANFRIPRISGAFTPVHAVLWTRIHELACRAEDMLTVGVKHV